jgi:hypothetical protein
MDNTKSINSNITWEPKLVNLSELKVNPQNPKIINDIGKKRLNKSLNKWGLAGTLLANLDMTLIDGHSRKKDLEAQGIEKVWVSFPSKLLTDEDYKVMNALFDVARAGEPDMMIIEDVFEDELIDEWELNKKPKVEIKEIELKPFVQTHVLISFPPEKMIELQPYLQKISDMPFVEFEQTSN